MATKYLTMTKSALQAKLLVQSPVGFNIAIVGENSTDYFAACAANTGLDAAVAAWLSTGSGGNLEGEGDLATATELPSGVTQTGYPGKTVAEITTLMNAIVTPV